MNAKRPDLCMLVKNALLFVGEHVSEEGKLDLAVFRLKQKMRQWSRTYHGQVICASVIQKQCKSHGTCVSCVS